jgi:uncharacterized membrane protein
MGAAIKTVFALSLAIFLINQASAAYITGDIYLDEEGNSRFDTETDINVNIPGLVFENNRLAGTTNQLLTLKGGIWTLDLSLQEYDDIFIEIHLPKNLVSIRSVEGVDNIIDIEEKTVTIADSGKLDFKMSYILREQKNHSWFYWLITIVVLVCGFAVYKKITKRKERFQNILPMINEKEQQIIDLLMKKPMRQKELRNQLNLPKASFSRYMVNLEKKKLILREGEGKNKLVKLK